MKMKKISLATETGETITFHVKSWESINTIMPKIQESKGLLPDQHRVVHVETKLEDNGTVHQFYCIRSDIQIEVIRTSPRVNSIMVDIESSKTIADLKAIIQEKEGLAADKQRLVWLDLGKEIDDAKTLADYNIKNGSRLYLSLPWNTSY